VRVTRGMRTRAELTWDLETRSGRSEQTGTL
jgi:hypothetical protein